MKKPLSRACDLDLARRIHMSMLPEPFDDRRFECALSYHPMEQVGGDYCHVEYLDRGRLAVGVSDVTGVGVPAALMVSRVNSFVQSQCGARRSPADLVDSLNLFLCRYFSGIGLFLTFFAAILDPARRRIRYAGAGHPAAIIVPEKGAPALLESQNAMLGIEPMQIRESSARLERKSLILFLTDGVLEARNGRRRQYGLERLLSRLEKVRGAGAANVVRDVWLDLRRFSGGKIQDDCLLLALRIK